jgi:hypothetical protein
LAVRKNVESGYRYTTLVDRPDLAREALENVFRDKLEIAQRQYAEAPSQKTRLGLLRALRQFTELVMNRKCPAR